MKLTLVFLLLLLCFPSILGKLNAKELTISSDEQFSTISQFFYNEKEMSVALALMEYENSMMDREEISNDDTFITMSIYFYSEVFKNYPKEINKWLDELAKLSNKRWRSVIIVSIFLSEIPNTLDALYGKAKELQFSKEEIQKFKEISHTFPDPVTIRPSVPLDNDVLWAAFFASGKQEYLSILIDAACRYNEREDLTEFITSGTARWSLGANASKHKLVLKTLKTEARKRGGEEMAIINDIISRSKSQQGIERLAWDYQLGVINIQERIEWEDKFNALDEQLVRPIIGEYKPLIIDNFDTYIQKIINSVDKLESYRSIIFVRDLEFQNNQWPNNEIINWKIKYQKPNKYHIRQNLVLENYPSGGVDLWVLNDSKMADKYMFDWFQAIEEDYVPRTNINKFTQLLKYLEIIQNQSLDEIQELADERNNYYHILSYSFGPNDLFGPFRMENLRNELVESLFHIFWEIDDTTAIPKILPLTSNTKVNHSILVNHLEPLSNDHLECTLQLFILPDSHLINRAIFKINGKLRDSGLPISIRIDEVFGDYNTELDIPQIE